MAQGRGVVPAWRAEGPPHGRRGRLGEHGVRGKGEFHAEVFLAEHAEGAEGWVSRRARRGAEDWVSRRGAEGAEVDRLKAVARLPLNGYRDMLGG